MPTNQPSICSDSTRVHSLACTVISYFSPAYEHRLAWKERPKADREKQIFEV